MTSRTPQETAPHFVASEPACTRASCTGAHPASEACSYRVAWSINPHMRVGTVEPWRAVGQHGGFVRALRRAGARVSLVPFVHGAYDSVFAKDNALLRSEAGGSSALLTRPRHAVRRAEQHARGLALQAMGFRIVSPLSSPLEGGDVVGPSDTGRRGYVGFGFRSSPASVSTVERFFDAPFTPLELRSPALYHLDMVLARLGPWTLVCEEALTPSSLHDLRRAEGRDALVPVPACEALRFALNFVVVGTNVVLGAGAGAFEERIARLGYRPVPVPLSQFQLAGGSAACLVSRVHRRDGVALRTTAAMRSTAA